MTPSSCPVCKSSICQRAPVGSQCEQDGHHGHRAKVQEDSGTPTCRLSWYRVVCPCGFESGYMIGKGEAMARATVHNERPDLDLPESERP